MSHMSALAAEAQQALDAAQKRIDDAAFVGWRELIAATFAGMVVAWKYGRYVKPN
jgi:hypothetical protein